MNSENIFFNSEDIKKIIDEVRKEQHISPKIKDEVLCSYIKEGMYDINNNCGTIINYNDDLKARSLLKNYVMYANYKRLAEFKELYGGDYVTLQAEYIAASSL